MSDKAHGKPEVQRNTQGVFVPGNGMEVTKLQKTL